MARPAGYSLCLGLGSDKKPWHPDERNWQELVPALVHLQAGPSASLGPVDDTEGMGWGFRIFRASKPISFQRHSSQLGEPGLQNREA